MTLSCSQYCCKYFSLIHSVSNNTPVYFLNKGLCQMTAMVLRKIMQVLKQSSKVQLVIYKTNKVTTWNLLNINSLITMGICTSVLHNDHVLQY